MNVKTYYKFPLQEDEKMMGGGGNQISQNEENNMVAIDEIKKYKDKRTKNVTYESTFEEQVTQLADYFNRLIQDSDRDAKSKIDAIIQLSIKNQTIEIFCEFCAEILKSGEPSEYPGINQNMNILFKMLMHLMNSSDKDKKVNTIISQKPCFLTIATKKLKEWKEQWNGGEKKSSVQLKEERPILEMLCAILHNISKYEDNVPNVRKADCIGAMSPYLDTEDNRVRLLCLATIADLVKESECDIIKSNNDIIKFLMTNTSAAMKNGSYEGWSLEELCRIIHHVARNDENKTTVAENGAIPLLVEIMKSDNIDAQYEAVCAIWELMFDKNLRQHMINETKLNVKETLEKLAKSQNKRVKKICSYALWKINPANKVTGSSSRHIMLSYKWLYQKMVLQIRDGLHASSLKTWVDVDNLQGSTLGAMAEAVEQAAVVLVCYSSAYKKSRYCRAEAEYAFQLGKTIIPLKMEANYEPDGWLAFIISSQLYYEFSGTHPPEDKMEKLITAIQNDLIRKHAAQHAQEVSEHTVDAQPETTLRTTISGTLGKRREEDDDTTKRVMAWNDLEVEKWLNHSGFYNQNKQHNSKWIPALRGKDVVFLKLLVCECPKTFYQLIEEKLFLKEMKAVSDFRLALKYIDNYKQSRVTKQKRKNQTNKDS